MTRENDQTIKRLLEQAERERTCLVPSTDAMKKALLRRVGATVVSPYPGVFAERATWGKLDGAERHRRLARAIAGKHPDWIFCSFTAACLWGLEVSWRHLDVLHVCGATKPASRSAVYLQRHLTEPQEEARIDGMQVTPLGQTVVDCLLETGFTDGMTVADSALGKNGVTREMLLEEVELRRAKCKPRCAKTAAHVLEYADARAESGGESVARARMIATGFAPDHLQYELVDPYDSALSMRSDFAWEQMARVLTLGELDGLVKYTDEAMLAGRTTAEKLVEERQRESHLSVYGHPLVRFTMRDVRKPGLLENMLQIAGVRQSTLPVWFNDVEL